MYDDKRSFVAVMSDYLFCLLNNETLTECRMPIHAAIAIIRKHRPGFYLPWPPSPLSVHVNYYKNDWSEQKATGPQSRSYMLNRRIACFMIMEQ